MKNINPPADIQMAMEKQMRAERERREAILRAEGEKKSAVLIAEGNKEAVILGAEAAKQAAIKAAEGEAEAILMVQRATADGIRLLSEAGATKEVLTLKSLEAFEKAADGKATKIIIPAEIQGMAGLASALTGIVEGTGTPEKAKTGNRAIPAGAAAQNTADYSTQPAAGTAAPLHTQL